MADTNTAIGGIGIAGFVIAVVSLLVVAVN